MGGQEVECISKRCIHIACFFVIGARLRKVSGTWWHSSSSWSSDVTSHLTEQRLGAHCSYFVFASLCFVFKCSCYVGHLQLSGFLEAHFLLYLTNVVVVFYPLTCRSVACAMYVNYVCPTTIIPFTLCTEKK